MTDTPAIPARDVRQATGYADAAAIVFAAAFATVYNDERIFTDLNRIGIACDGATAAVRHFVTVLDAEAKR